MRWVILLQASRVLWLGEGTITLSYCMYVGLMVLGRQKYEVHTVEQLVPEPSAFEVAMAIEKLKSYILPRIDQIPAEMIKSGGRTIRFEIH